VEITAIIRKRGRKWVVMSKDGKVLGEHDTKGDAEKQLQAIEISKHSKKVKKSSVDAVVSAMVGAGNIELAKRVLVAFNATDANVEAKKLINKMNQLSGLLEKAKAGSETAKKLQDAINTTKKQLADLKKKSIG